MRRFIGVLFILLALFFASATNSSAYASVCTNNGGVCQPSSLGCVGGTSKIPGSNNLSYCGSSSNQCCRSTCINHEGICQPASSACPGGTSAIANSSGYCGSGTNLQCCKSTCINNGGTCQPSGSACPGGSSTVPNSGGTCGSTSLQCCKNKCELKGGTCYAGGCADSGAYTVSGSTASDCSAIGTNYACCTTTPPVVACTNPASPGCTGTDGNESTYKQNNCCTGFTCIPYHYSTQSPTAAHCQNATNACNTATNPPVNPISCTTPGVQSNCCANYKCVNHPAGMQNGVVGNSCEYAATACIGGVNPISCTTPGVQSDCCTGFTCVYHPPGLGGVSGNSCENVSTACVGGIDPSTCNVVGEQSNCCDGNMCQAGDITNGFVKHCESACSSSSNGVSCSNTTGCCDPTEACNTTTGKCGPINPICNIVGGCDKDTGQYNLKCDNTGCDTAIGHIDTTTLGFVKTLFGAALSLVGILAVLLIIFSGFKLATSRGNPEKVKDAQEQLTAAIVGLLFVIFSLVFLEVIGIDILGLPISL